MRPGGLVRLEGNRFGSLRQSTKFEKAEFLRKQARGSFPDPYSKLKAIHAAWRDVRRVQSHGALILLRDASLRGASE